MHIHPAIRRSSTFLLGLTVSLVVLTDSLFYGHGIGWNAALLALALLSGLCFRNDHKAGRRGRIALATGIAGLALALALDSTVLSLVMTGLFIVVFAISARAGASGSFATWLGRIGVWSLVGWCWLALDCVTGFRRLRRHPESRPRGPIGLLHLAWRWTIPAVLSGGFLFLFSLANPVVEHWVSRAEQHLINFISHLPDLFEIERILFWLATSVVVWSLLRVRRQLFRPESRRVLQAQPEASIAEDSSAGQRGLVVRCLILFNAVFAMETALDLVYLWGGRALPHGMTFKEYAHRGAYPLIATALLAGAFVLLTFGKDCQGSSWRTARRLVYAWIAQNILLTFSAGWRLMLLVNASNLTRWRLATAIWLALVAAGLATIIWRIVTSRDNAWLLRANTALATIVLYVCCFLNLDGFIADYNAAHCMDVARNGDPLGLTYLKALGATSIPALDRLSHTLDTQPRRDMAARFAGELRQQLASDMKDWRMWTYRRGQLNADDDRRPTARDSHIARN